MKRLLSLMLVLLALVAGGCDSMDSGDGDGNEGGGEESTVVVDEQ